ncbi:MAG: lipoyl(octanoyl) transferase LipB [Bacteroidota bacterium]
MQDCRLKDLGLIDYEEAWQLQKQLFNKAIEQKLTGNSKELIHHLLVCEHPPVYTFGKSADKANLLLTAEEMQEKQIQQYDVERGGDITYHGPGQLVVYPIFDIETLKIGVKDFVFKVEECIIRTLQQFGIESERINGRIGIWLGKDSEDERKIAAIGIKCSRFITMHGLALNVNTDLKYFDYIIPCGIKDKAVTSIANEIHRQIDFTDVKKVLINEFSATFELKFI